MNMYPVNLAEPGGQALVRKAATWSADDSVPPPRRTLAAALPDAVAVRDSKDPDGPKLIFTPADWAAFTEAVRASA